MEDDDDERRGGQEIGSLNVRDVCVCVCVCVWRV